MFGYVSFVPGDPEGDGADQEPSDFASSADFTDQLAEANPEWKMDLCDEVIGTWRGEAGNRADMTLVWGVPQIRGGAIATAELADLCVDQCALVEDRFTLIAPDDYRKDFLEIKLFNIRGEELASESLYARTGTRTTASSRCRCRSCVGADPVDQPVLGGLLRREEAVALHVVGDLLARLPGVLGVDLLHPPAQDDRLLGVDLDVGRLALVAAVRLVDEDARVGQRLALALRAAGEDQRAHRHRDPAADRRHVGLDEVHRVVDRQPGVDDCRPGS